MSIETKLAEISAGLCPNVDGCDTCDTKRKLVAALRRAIEFTNGDWEFSENGNALKKTTPRQVVDFRKDIEQILSEP